MVGKNGGQNEREPVLNNAHKFHTQTNAHCPYIVCVFIQNSGEIKEPHTGTDMNFKLLNEQGVN